MAITYNAEGKIRGKCWGGGFCYFKARRLHGFNTKEELITTAEEMFRNKKLDAGFGFESLTGALLEIEELDTIIVNDKEYTHSEYELHEIGEIPEEDFDRLIFELL